MFKIKYCIDCKKQVSKNSIRCYDCAAKERMQRQETKNKISNSLKQYFKIYPKVCLCRKCNCRVNNIKVKNFWIEFFQTKHKMCKNFRRSIYLCGCAGSGKSVCSKYLIKKGYQLAKMAYPVYNIAYNYFNMNNKIKDRKLLQIIGTDVGRNEDENIWINRFLIDVRIVRLTKHYLNIQQLPFVCDDVRFINEHEALQKEGWLGIYLDVDDETRIKRLQHRDSIAQIETLNHVSETALNEFKHELISIDATCSLQEMFNNLEKVIDEK